MAEKVKLRDYQKSILDRLDIVRSDATSVVESYLGVQIGGNNVLVNLLDVSETLVVTEIQPVPLVKPWFLGISNVRGVLYAINDLNQLLNKQFTNMSSDTRILLVNNSIFSNVGILVDRLVGLRHIDVFTMKENEKEESVCFKPEVYEDSEKKPWRIMDFEKLVSSREFEIPYVT
ncbi:MAG TPA: chemotaxis protein CheW [Methylophilaceae bacterium]|nr:chemotaxis protein CheW [Methylophilaceae bacterium]